MIPSLIIAGVILLAIAVLFVVAKLRRKRQLPAGVRKILLKQWEEVRGMTDNHRKVMDAEKILDHALTTLGYSGSFGEKLKAAGPRFSRVQQVWEAHKLRNRIAHEVGITVNDRDCNTALAAFERALKDLC